MQAMKYVSYGVFTMADTNTDKMSLQPICICIGVGVCVGFGQCEHTMKDPLWL